MSVQPHDPPGLYILLDHTCEIIPRNLLTDIDQATNALTKLHENHLQRRKAFGANGVL